MAPETIHSHRYGEVICDRLNERVADILRRDYAVRSTLLLFVVVEDVDDVPEVD